MGVVVRCAETTDARRFLPEVSMTAEVIALVEAIHADPRAEGRIRKD